MRIISKPKEEKKLYRCECENCGTYVEFSGEESYCKPDGLNYIICPVCKRETNTWAEELEFNVTLDNMVFPGSFTHFGTSAGAVKLKDEEVIKYIKEGIEYLRENPDNFCWSCGTGDTMIFIQNFSGDENYVITVAKNYYELNLAYDKIDFTAQEINNWNWVNKGKRCEMRDHDEVEF